MNQTHLIESNVLDISMHSASASSSVTVGQFGLSGSWSSMEVGSVCFERKYSKNFFALCLPASGNSILLVNKVVNNFN